jgi:hypothetical protein
MQGKFMFLELLVRCGEYEFNCNSVHEVPKGSMEEVADNWARTFYDGEPDKSGNWYYFNGGEIGVRVITFQEITQNEFFTIKRYL